MVIGVINVPPLPGCVGDVLSVERDVDLLVVVVQEPSVLGPSVQTTKYLLTMWMLRPSSTSHNT